MFFLLHLDGAKPAFHSVKPAFHSAKPAFHSAKAAFHSIKTARNLPEALSHLVLEGLETIRYHCSELVDGYSFRRHR